MRLTVLFVVLIVIGCNKKTDNIPQAKIAVDTFSQNISEEEPEDTTTVSFSKTLTGNGYSYILKGRQNINDGINFKSIDIFHQKKLHQRIIFDTVSVLNESEAYFALKHGSFLGTTQTSESRKRARKVTIYA